MLLVRVLGIDVIYRQCWELDLPTATAEKASLSTLHESPVGLTVSPTAAHTDRLRAPSGSRSHFQRHCANKSLSYQHQLRFKTSRSHISQHDGDSSPLVGILLYFVFSSKRFLEM